MVTKRKWYYYIYKITFLCGEPKGRYYYGKRIYCGVDINKDNYRGSGLFCKSYFKKYGAIKGETYIKEIVEETSSAQENLKREAFWVGDLWKTDPLCMNLCPGGIGSHGSPSRKKRFWQFDLQGKFIKEFECLKDTSCVIGSGHVLSCCKRERNQAGGYIWRYEGDWVTDDDLSRIKNFKSCKVLQYNLAGEIVNIFDTPEEAAASINSNAYPIRLNCERGTKKFANYIWRYEDSPLTKEDLEWALSRIPKPCFSQRVYKYSLEGDLLEIFDNQKAAIEAFNGNINHLSNCLTGRLKTSAGFIWRYEDNQLRPKEVWIPGKAILQFDTNGKYIGKYLNSAEAARKTNSDMGGINKCCRRELLSSNGFMWRRLGDTVTDNDLQAYLQEYTTPQHHCCKYSKTGELIKEYNSFKEAADDNNVIAHSVYRWCAGKSHDQRGYVWKYKENDLCQN